MPLADFSHSGIAYSIHCPVSSCHAAGTPRRWLGGGLMDLYEYQARDLFAAHGVPVLPGIVAGTPAEARAAADQIGPPVVVKAQVKTGGRGKAGGVKLAATPHEAASTARAILGMDIRGHTVRRGALLPPGDGAGEEHGSPLLVPPHPP